MHLYVPVCVRACATDYVRMCVSLCGTVRTSLDKVVIVVFQHLYVDRTSKQNERERGKRDGQERARVCGKRE